MKETEKFTFLEIFKTICATFVVACFILVTTWCYLVSIFIMYSSTSNYDLYAMETKDHLRGLSDDVIQVYGETQQATNFTNTLYELLLNCLLKCNIQIPPCLANDIFVILVQKNCEQ